MLTSLLLDGFGWLGVAAEPIGARPGPARVVAGAVLIVRAQGAATATGRGPWLAPWLLAGAALPLQGAINAQLRADLGATIAVGAISFLVATAGIALLLGASLALSRERGGRASRRCGGCRGGAGSAASPAPST